MVMVFDVCGLDKIAKVCLCATFRVQNSDHSQICLFFSKYLYSCYLSWLIKCVRYAYKQLHATIACINKKFLAENKIICGTCFSVKSS